MLFSKRIKTALLSLEILFDVTYYPNGIEIRKAFEDNGYVTSPRPVRFIRDFNKKLKKDMGEVVINNGFTIFSGIGLVGYIYEFETKEQAFDYHHHNDMSHMANAILRDKYLYLDIHPTFASENGYFPSQPSVKEESQLLFTLFFDEQLLHNAFIQSVKLVRK